MADTAAPQTIEQRIRLVLEESIRTGQIAKELKLFLDRTREANKAAEDYISIIGNANKQTDKLSKTLFGIGAGLRNFASAIRLIGQGSVAAFRSVADGVKPLADLAAASLSADNALKTLRTTYSNIESANKNLRVSLQQSASVLADFAKQSVAARATLDQGMTESVANLMNELAAGFSADEAKSLVGDFIKAGPAPLMKKLLTEYKIGSQEMENAVLRWVPDAINQYQLLAQSVELAKGSGDSGVRTYQTWQQVMNQIGRIVADLQDKFAQTFGGTIVDYLQKLSNELFPKINDSIKQFFDWINQNQAGIKDFFGIIYKTIKAIADVLLQYPKLIAGAMAIKAIPGLGAILSGTAGGLAAPGARLVGKGLGLAGNTLGGLAGLTGATGTAAGVGVGGALLATAGAGAHVISGWNDPGFQERGGVLGGGYRFSGPDDVGPEEWQVKQAAAAREKAFAAEQAKINAQAKGAAAEVGPPRGAALSGSKAGTTQTKSLVSQLSEMKSAWEAMDRSIGAVNTGVDSFARMMETAGLQSEFAGKATTQWASEMAVNIDNNINLLRKQADEQAKLGQELLKKVQMAEVGADKEFKSEEDKNRAILLAQNEIAQAGEKRAKVEELIATKLKAQLRPIELLGERQSEITQIAKSNMEISRAMYGSAGLGVLAAQQVIASLQEEKKLNAENLRTVAEQLKLEPQRQDLQKKYNELLLKGKQITLEQLNAVKELRDGYLDAVTASAMGAGRFEKIIVTQEKNLGLALDERRKLVKENYLLGQQGAKAAAVDVEPIRFGAGGIGQLTTAGGQAVSAADAAAKQAANIQDPGQRALAQAAQLIASGGDSKEIERYIHEGLRAAGFLGTKGAPGQSVMEGEAARGAAQGVPLPTAMTPGEAQKTLKPPTGPTPILPAIETISAPAGVTLAHPPAVDAAATANTDRLISALDRLTAAVTHQPVAGSQTKLNESKSPDTISPTTGSIANIFKTGKDAAAKMANEAATWLKTASTAGEAAMASQERNRSGQLMGREEWIKLQGPTTEAQKYAAGQYFDRRWGDTQGPTMPEISAPTNTFKIRNTNKVGGGGGEASSMMGIIVDQLIKIAKMVDSASTEGTGVSSTRPTARSRTNFGSHR